MKKWLITAIVLFVVVLFALCVYLGVSLVSIHRQASGAEASSAVNSVEEYVAEHLQNYDADYAADTQTLTLYRVSTLTYEEACSFGGSVYADELAPETYLDQVYSISMDMIAQCQTEELTVVLCYTATDGEPIFTVSSAGEVWMCWD